MNAKPGESVAVPFGVVTTTSKVPADLAGEVNLTWVESTTENDVPAFPPTVTPVAPINSVPVRVTTVPPDVGPCDGLIDVAVAVGGGVSV